MTQIRREVATSIGPRAVAIALLVSAMWGANVVGIKMSLEAFPPIWSAFWRMLIGLPTLVIWARAGGVRLWPEPGEFRSLLLLGVMFGVQLMLLNVSISWTSAAYSAVLLNAAPLFTNVIAHYISPGDRLSKMRLIGLALAFAGVCIVLAGKPDPRLAPAPLAGNVLATLTAGIIGYRIVYTQRIVQTINSTRTLFWQVAISLPIFLVVAAMLEPPLSGELTLRPIAATLYCSIGVVGLAFILWVRLLEKHTPGLMSVFVFPTPLFGVLFSALLFDERIGALLVIGVALVAAGVFTVTWEKRPRA
jgi:drug/metabolite transporter (DMT)-like permease